MTGRAVDTGTGALLRGVWVAAPDDAWAVGDGGTILRWDGRRWARVESGTAEHLQAVHGCAAGEVWAAGWNGTVLRWDGRRWASQGAPSAREALSGVWVRGPGDVWIVGGTEQTARFVYEVDADLRQRPVGTEGRVSRALVLHHDGRGWTRGEPGGPEGWPRFEKVWAAPDRPDVWAVGGRFPGARGGEGLIARFDGAAWVLERSGLLHQLAGVFGFAGGPVFAAGGHRLLERRGLGWAVLPAALPYPESAQALWGRAPDDLLVATGGLWRYDGRGWARQEGPPGEEEATLSPGLWAGADGGAWLVGAGGRARFWP